jgi:hypothetical protein
MRLAMIMIKLLLSVLILGMIWVFLDLYTISMVAIGVIIGNLVYHKILN